MIVDETLEMHASRVKETTHKSQTYPKPPPHYILNTLDVLVFVYSLTKSL